jgi:hypothetical protein
VPAGACEAIAELLSPAAGAAAEDEAEADESVAEVLVPAVPEAVELVSELELHELRASRQAAKRGREARSMIVEGKRECCEVVDYEGFS